MVDGDGECTYPEAGTRQEEVAAPCQADAAVSPSAACQEAEPQTFPCACQKAVPVRRRRADEVDRPEREGSGRREDALKYEER